MSQEQAAIICNGIIRKCFLFVIMALSPPPGLPLPPTGTVLLISDLGLAVCDEEKGKPIELPMEVALHKAALNMSCRVVSIPGAGALEIGERLVGLVPKTNTVIVVWLLNELFDEQGILLSADSVDKVWSNVEESARTLAGSLRRFKHRMAVIGGSHRLWSVAEKFDEYVSQVTRIVEAEGVYVDNNRLCV